MIKPLALAATLLGLATVVSAQRNRRENVPPPKLVHGAYSEVGTGGEKTRVAASPRPL